MPPNQGRTYAGGGFRVDDVNESLHRILDLHTVWHKFTEAALGYSGLPEAGSCLSLPLLERIFPTHSRRSSHYDDR